MANKSSSGLFNKLFGKSEHGLSSLSGEILPILDAPSLLGADWLAEKISEIQALVAAPAENFDSLYRELISRYAEFVQALPNITYKAYDCKYGQIKLAMLRAEFMLSPIHLVRLPYQNTSQLSHAKREAIWKFALFTAGLLVDLGQIILQFKVVLCKSDGILIENWDPLLHSMPQTKASHFKIRYINHNYEANLAKKLNLILLHKIIPAHALSWIYSDYDIFLEWIAVLMQDSSSSGTLLGKSLAATLKLVKKKAEEASSASFEMANQLADSYLSKEFLSSPDTDSSFSKDELTELFFDWLEQGIINHTISINEANSYVHLTEMGAILLSPEIFKAFCRNNPYFRNWAFIYKHLLYLGLSPASAGDPQFAEIFAKNPLVIGKYGLLITRKQHGNLSAERVNRLLNSPTQRRSEPQSDVYPKLTSPEHLKPGAEKK